jgi:PAS domain S-box-containing protein
MATLAAPIMVPRPRPIWARYGAAALAVLVFLVVRWAAGRWFGQTFPGSALFFVILFSAWYGGFGPAMLSAVIIFGIALIAPERRARSGGYPINVVLLYWIFVIVIAGFGGMIARARQRIGEQFDELTRQREQLEATLRSIGDAVIVTDAAGRILSLNAIAERLTGWTGSEAVGLLLGKIFRIINEHTRQTVDSPVERALAEGTIVGLANHTLLIAKDGSERPIDDSAAPIHDASGRLAGVVLVFRDTTERRERERGMADEARRKDEFLALLAHELRNPLAPIYNALQILKLSEDDPASSRIAREVAERQVIQLTRLVDDLLDVSRIMRGKVALRLERLDLASVVAQAVETARPAIDADRHELVVSVPKEPVWINADGVRLTQVLSNLLSNAAKYTESGGRISLTAEIENEAVVVCVADNGIGIDSELLPRVFEMFMQVAPGAPRSQGGLGIGLTLVKNLVDLHGGSVAAKSAGSGQGSEFFVRLPLAVALEEGCAPDESNEQTAIGGPSRRILVVDDNVDAARSLGVLLKLRGHDVALAFSGEEALAAIQERVPEIVFLDIGMPGMDGIQVARRLREGFSTSLWLVALTGWGTEQDRQKSRAAGFDRHLTKPVDLAAVEAVLAECTTVDEVSQVAEA